MNPLLISDIGLISYTEAYALQQRLAAARKAEAIGDVLLLCEHPHVITLGRNAKRENLLVSEHVLRQKGTEPAFTGAYWNAHDEATYACAGCGAKLFASDTKYDSGSGWPSFTAPAAEDAVATETDSSHGMRRVEVTCARCGGHLGHVFDDGPLPTGLRYCMNGVALKFTPDAA